MLTTMKLIHVVLLSGAQSGRPSSHGVLFSTDVHVDVLGGNPSCFPQNTQIDGDWRRECITAEECCSKRIVKSATKTGKDPKYIYVCGCIPAGKSIEGDPKHCCSGVADKQNSDKCGCLAPNTGPQSNESMRILPLDRNDCCHKSATVDDTSPAAVRGETAGYNLKKFQKCGPRECASPGTAPVAGGGVCCGGFAAHLATKGGEKACGCIPAKTIVHPKLETVEGHMCCSGSYTDGDNGDVRRTCGCTQGGQELSQYGGKESDCCYVGLAPDGTCQNEKCVVPHKQKLAKGDKCCTERKGEIPEAVKANVTTGRNDYCGCIKGGTKIDADKESWCCSRTRGSDGRCSWVSVTKKIHPDYMTESECFSGEANDNDVCLCMRPNSALRGDIHPEHKSECCSDGLNLANNRCSCVLSGTTLKEGSNREDCCTGLVDPENPDVCKCGPIGLPYKPRKALGMQPPIDCCTGEERNGFCACVKPGGQAKAEFCCAKPDKEGCGCQQGGTVVNAGNTAKDVCCSGSSKTIKDQDCDIEVCEDQPGSCSRALLSLTKVSVNNLGGQGPNAKDSHTMVFDDVFPDIGRKVNLVISANTPYVPKNSVRNGAKGQFGVINIKSGKEVGLRFGFVNAATGAAETVPAFQFSFKDLDTGKNGGQEYVKVTGYKSYKMAANTAVTAKGGFFYGSEYGGSYDNPTDLRKMTEEQKRRVVSFEFPSCSGFDVIIGAKGGAIIGAKKGPGGRNIFFGGASELYC